MTPADPDIWRVLAEIAEATGWPASAVIDTAVETYGFDRNTCARIYRERSTWQGE